MQLLFSQWTPTNSIQYIHFCGSFLSSVLPVVFQDNVSSLLPVFEEFLKDAPQDASYDSVRQSVVILMGSLAKHLEKSDPKVKPIVAKLITALSTPSQQVLEQSLETDRKARTLNMVPITTFIDKVSLQQGSSSMLDENVVNEGGSWKHITLAVLFKYPSLVQQLRFLRMCI